MQFKRHSRRKQFCSRHLLMKEMLFRNEFRFSAAFDRSYETCPEGDGIRNRSTFSSYEPSWNPSRCICCILLCAELCVRTSTLDERKKKPKLVGFCIYVQFNVCWLLALSCCIISSHLIWVLSRLPPHVFNSLFILIFVVFGILRSAGFLFCAKDGVKICRVKKPKQIAFSAFHLPESLLPPPFDNEPLLHSPHHHRRRRLVHYFLY